MAQNEAYQRAEQKIEEARRSGATGLDLSTYKDSDRLTELPESLGHLIQLHSLNLGGNQLTALPESLRQLRRLQSLDLSGNQLTTLPEWLGQLTQLRSLDLSRNQLTALPESISQLTQLQSLHLSGNQLTDVTSGFRAAGPRCIDLFALHYPAEYLGDTVESLVIAVRTGCSVQQIPVEMRVRAAGNPSQSSFKAAVYLLRAVAALGLALVRQWPVPEEVQAAELPQSRAAS